MDNQTKQNIINMVLDEVEKRNKKSKTKNENESDNLIPYTIMIPKNDLEEIKIWAKSEGVDVFKKLAQRRERGEINKTVTVSFRLIESERDRTEKILKENGYTLASGAKTAFYKFIKELSK